MSEDRMADVDVPAAGGDDGIATDVRRELSTALKQVVKRALFPGVDVHARSRYRHLPRFFLRGDIETLDAGCGNGMLSYAAYRLGNRVLGVSIDGAEIDRARRFYAAIGADGSRLRFEQGNLYNLRERDRRYDQIICVEALEHVRDDQLVVNAFAEILRPGGVLHLCCPNASHPVNALGRTDEPEDGRHVRDGYTNESYRRLLEPAGFEIEFAAGIGSAAAVKVDSIVRGARDRWGHGLAVPLLVATLPVRWRDTVDPAEPVSLYVMARRR